MLLVCGHAFATPLPCPVTSGPLTLNCINPRSGGAGISPLLVFFDCSGTTDTSLSANQSVTQDVNFIWNFNDRSPLSGAGTWSLTLPGGSGPILTGSGSGYRYKQTATGIIAAHMYLCDSNVNGCTDSAYTAIVQATDPSGNTATCGMSITVFDASGSNGFQGTKTTCFGSPAPVAGLAGCPAGANVVNSTSYTTATNTANLGAGKRVLLACGQTFTGNATTIGANPTTTSGGTPGTQTPTWSLGAFGSCVNTQSGRPVLSGGTAIDWVSLDGRIADLDFESASTTPINVGPNFAVSTGIPASEITIYNVLSNASGSGENFYASNWTQWGLIQTVGIGQGNTTQGTFPNYAENNCTNNSPALNCGNSTPGPYVNIQYGAMIGGFYNGQSIGESGSGVETVRVSACRMCVFSNNTMENANTVGATFKFHSGNTKNSSTTFIGQFAEIIEVSDSVFAGTSGAQLVENTPQNPETDERLRLIVFERNLLAPSGSNQKGSFGGINLTVRDNVFSGTENPTFGFQVCARGIEPTPQFVEVYHNTGKLPGGGTLVGFTNGGVCAGAAAENSIATNNLLFGAGAATSNSGSGNTVSNNTTTPSCNPDFLNDSGTFVAITDFKPTATSCVSGGTTVPVLQDALGQPWSVSTDLGAVRH